MKRTASLLFLLLCLSPLSVFAAENSVDLVWQGSGYTPPFYEGRTLWGRQTQVTFFAIPHVYDTNGNEIPASSLIYRWSKDGTILGSLSGPNQNTISFLDSIIGFPIGIKIDIMTDDSTVVASAYATLSATTPFVDVYENSPLYGYLFNHEARQGITLSDKEITLAAFPFLFSVDNKSDPSITYSWSPAGTSAPGENITYRTTGDSAGSANVSVSVDAPNILNQSAGENFLVQFNNKNENSF